ncbi:hypothetical protein COLO4_37019 [Corchorus olitorius]|uniref:Uncharacterized protein n=1 Tax=Corchorus olitorius TaxID=93759 RepID=A0A1R3G3U0_9ROSI|nr:hypothetical protein COLO4_37019 [Corchorus olitorius]
MPWPPCQQLEESKTLKSKGSAKQAIADKRRPIQL